MALTASLGTQAPSTLPHGGGRPSPEPTLCATDGAGGLVRATGHRTGVSTRVASCRQTPALVTAVCPWPGFWQLGSLGNGPQEVRPGSGVWRKAARMRTWGTWVTVLTVPCLGLLSASVSPSTKWTVAVMWLAWTTRGEHAGTTPGKALGRRESPCELPPATSLSGGAGLAQVGVLGPQRCKLKFCQRVSAQQARLSPGR